jgi:hypothetical protein
MRLNSSFSWASCDGCSVTSSRDELFWKIRKMIAANRNRPEDLLRINTFNNLHLDQRVEGAELNSREIFYQQFRVCVALVS